MREIQEMIVDAAMDYLDFVPERHRVWEQRQAGHPQPWTADPILAARKFTNVFRVLDVGSQFLLSILENAVPEDVAMRAFLYRFTNRPEPWTFFNDQHGRYPTCADLYDGVVLDTWRAYRDQDNPIFGSAYRVHPPQPHEKHYPVFGPAYRVHIGAQNKGVDKLVWVVENAREQLPRVLPLLLAATSQRERLLVLETVPRIGEFMSMQIVTDIGYVAGWDENEDVVAGLGAVRGTAHVFPDEKARWVIDWARERILENGVPLLAGRPPSLMDVQNTFCEFDKYVRFQNKPAAVKPYTPVHPGPQPVPILPKHWS